MNKMVEWRKNVILRMFCFAKDNFSCSRITSCLSSDKLPRTGYLVLFLPFWENFWRVGLFFEKFAALLFFFTP